VWLSGEPGNDCPYDDSEVYAGWAARFGPITIRNAQTGLELVWVPSGSCMMGSVRGKPDEKPVRKVSVDGFWIGRTPVTVRQWQQTMGSLPPQYNDQGPQHPVAGVTWDECREFCQRVHVGLPTETHWEYAARGREGHIYPWGNHWDPAICQSKEDLHGHQRTAPVGSFPENASWCGAIDMAGNLWEWCRDWYYPNSAEAAPTVATGRRSLRGGAWACDSFECRSSCRLFAAPSNRSPLIGVRVARPKATESAQ
jgi:formylglycine-generating enzyme required for sulfatase activity